jgi:ATP synthase protein I
VTEDRDGRRDEERRLEERVGRQIDRIKRAERERRSILAQTVYLGTLGVLLVLPVVVGAYVGNWLDSRLQGYAVHWTISLIFIGVVVGAVNVYLFIRE